MKVSLHQFLCVQVLQVMIFVKVLNFLVSGRPSPFRCPQLTQRAKIFFVLVSSSLGLFGPYQQRSIKTFHRMYHETGIYRTDLKLNCLPFRLNFAPTAFIGRRKNCALSRIHCVAINALRPPRNLYTGATHLQNYAPKTNRIRSISPFCILLTLRLSRHPGETFFFD